MRDLTFLPRASDESITFGSSGLFMTAEDLARWCHALFDGQILKEHSMNEMLRLERGSHGLGIGRFGKDMGYGQIAYGHAGATIGASSYMVHLPDHHFSVAVMINGFNHDCSRDITRKITEALLLELDTLNIFQYLFYVFSPWGPILVAAIAIWTVVIAVRIRKKKSTIPA